jgi:hypothetical protein
VRGQELQRLADRRHDRLELPVKALRHRFQIGGLDNPAAADRDIRVAGDEVDAVGGQRVEVGLC